MGTWCTLSTNLRKDFPLKGLRNTRSSTMWHLDYMNQLRETNRLAKRSASGIEIYAKKRPCAKSWGTTLGRPPRIFKNPVESQSKPGIKIANPNQCKELQRRPRVSQRQFPSWVVLLLSCYFLFPKLDMLPSQKYESKSGSPSAKPSWNSFSFGAKGASTR